MSYSDVNRVVLVGRLTRDPQLSALPSGSELCKLRVACNSVRRELDGSYQQRANFFDVAVFGAQAASVARYMHVGRRMAIDGRLQWSEWEAADGAKRQAVEIVAERVEFLDGPAGAAGEDEGEQDPGEEPGRPLVGAASGIDDEVAF